MFGFIYQETQSELSGGFFFSRVSLQWRMQKCFLFLHRIFQQPIKAFGPGFRLFILELKAFVQINSSFSKKFCLHEG
jgi:hypothetical protein